MQSCKWTNEENYIEPTNVSQSNGVSEYPSIAVDSRKTVHLVWYDRSSYNEEIIYAMKDNGEDWTTPVQVTYNAGSSRFPQIIIDKNDKIHLAWQQIVYQNSFSYWTIFYTSRVTGDTWVIPETISVYGASL